MVHCSTLAAYVLIQPAVLVVTLNDIAIRSSRRAAICTLVVATFRRRNKGPFCINSEEK